MLAQGIWIRRLMQELEIKFELHLRLYSDNRAAISIASDPVQYDRTKHIEIDCIPSEKDLDSKEICAVSILSTQQLADVFTKGMVGPRSQSLLDKLEMDYIYHASLEGEWGVLKKVQLE